MFEARIDDMFVAQNVGAKKAPWLMEPKTTTCSLP